MPSNSSDLTAQRVYAKLREDILNGEREPGTRLGEMALCKEFNVSRGPVRAALSLLAEAGILTIVPHSGASVRVISREDARALYEVRAALESEAASLAAAAIGPNTAEQLRDLLLEHTRQVKFHPTGAYVQTKKSSDFHLVVARLSDNPVLLHYLSKELYPQMALLRSRHKHVQGRGLTALKEHQRIAEAILEGDSEVAGILMRRHINISWESFESQLDVSG